MRVIGDDGRPLGVLSKDEALKLAREANLDLVLVSTKSNPPTAKIVDWGQYNYQKKKQQQQVRQANSNKAGDLKQMRFSIKIGESDMNIKLRKVSKFLEEGHKVRLAVILKGREMEHKDLAFELARKLIAKLESIGVVEQNPQFSGRQVSMIMRSDK